ncbi:sugar-binding domain-containing protein [Pedobacter sp. SYSU D00535]|uniref:sugar-binding domain-containing protein n=1 Tax=Pedobacter sp. SYSU D00535 TaxID=2810308 RepID=UPI001F605DD3|nr:sugar-binding domain-containing protein [Pedobacter sp. SYSU D00535]
MRFIFSLLLFAFSTGMASGQSKENRPRYRDKIDLKGQWQFALDQNDQGIREKWFLKELPETVQLPGTTDLNKKGILNKDTTTMHLNRIYKYEGPAWYRKKVIIPKGFANKRVELFLERTKPSQVWIDDQLVGGSFLLQSAQRYEVGKYLSPGEHVITIRVDNNLKLTPYGNVHIYSDDTQTNWNGILGELYLEAAPKTFISNLQVYPDVPSKSFTAKLELENGAGLKKVSVDLILEKHADGKITRLKTLKQTRNEDQAISITYPLGEEMDLWDEYRQPIYHLTALIGNGKTKDARTVTFGMREFKTSGTQFTINGRKVFLRGKHEAAVFPLTGYPPMDEEGWLRVFRIAKSYGINHYRFHSYCPSEAAFSAADKLGIYLQPELPFWGSLETDSVAQRMQQEGIVMLKSYANHPSFVMFSHGNELGGKLDRVHQNITALKSYDSRPLYTAGTNIWLGYHWPEKVSDFFIGGRTPSDGDTTSTHVRLTFAYADSREGGILNTQRPSASVNFDHSVTRMKVPIISHEIGQYQIYPDYSEIRKYTGVLEARNLQVFRNRLAKAGMLDQARDFQKASGAWSALCYKAEMEAALHTRGFGGFQLLDLQDFPGQGTALVGILDAFMDSKEVISREDWLKSCNDVVLLLDFPKYCYTNKERFSAKLSVANYSDKVIFNPINWVIKDRSGQVLKQGTIAETNMSAGDLHSIGQIEFSLAGISTAAQLTVHVSIANTSYANTYPVWVYPTAASVTGLSGIEVSSRLDKGTLASLSAGGKVLFFPRAEDMKQKSVKGLFPPEFWNWGMFKGISEWAKKPVSPGTLGILTNPTHPIFNAFPTDAHTNWQWFSIIKASHSFILDETDKHYRPIVQMIDNLERNHKMGLIFEFKVGKGKLLVCTAPLRELKDKPEALQLYQSILNYMNSPAFDPGYEISAAQLRNLFSK